MFFFPLNLHLADPEVAFTKETYLLLGADIFGAFNFATGLLFTNTKQVWIIGAFLKNTLNGLFKQIFHIPINDLNRTLATFWE